MGNIMVYKKIEKADFIKRAAELINIMGYNFSSVDDIAKKCGLSKASVYHYVASKRELAELVLNHFHQTIRETIFKPVLTSGLPAEEKLQLLADKLGVFYINRLGGCLMGNLVSEVIDSQPEFYGVLKTFFDDWIHTIARILGEKLNTDTARKIAEDMTAQFQGAIMLGRLYKTNHILMRVIERLGALLQVRDNALVATSEC